MHAKKLKLIQHRPQAETFGGFEDRVNAFVEQLSNEGYDAISMRINTVNDKTDGEILLASIIYCKPSPRPGSFMPMKDYTGHGSYSAEAVETATPH